MGTKLGDKLAWIFVCSWWHQLKIKFYLHSSITFNQIENCQMWQKWHECVRHKHLSDSSHKHCNDHSIVVMIDASIMELVVVRRILMTSVIAHCKLTHFPETPNSHGREAHLWQATIFITPEIPGVKPHSDCIHKMKFSDSINTLAQGHHPMIDQYL